MRGRRPQLPPEAKATNYVRRGQCSHATPGIDGNRQVMLVCDDSMLCFLCNKMNPLSYSISGVSIEALERQ